MRHSEAIRRNPDDVPGRIPDVRNDLDPEERVDVVLGMEPLEDSVAVPGVEVERPQDLPTSEVVDDLDQRLLAIALDEAELHAGLRRKQFFCSASFTPAPAPTSPQLKAPIFLRSIFLRSVAFSAAT